MRASEVIIKITEQIKENWMDFEITDYTFPYTEEITIYL